MKKKVKSITKPRLEDPENYENLSRFKKLRYTKSDDGVFYEPRWTQDEVAEKAKVSKALISKLENYQYKEGEAPNCNCASIMRLHDFFHVSYDYLFTGVSSTREERKMKKDPILCQFGDSFWRKLKYAVRMTPKYDDTIADAARIHLLKVLLSNPRLFSDILDEILNYLCEFYKYNIKKEKINREYSQKRSTIRDMRGKRIPRDIYLYDNATKEFEAYENRFQRIIVDYLKNTIYRKKAIIPIIEDCIDIENKSHEQLLIVTRQDGQEQIEAIPQKHDPCPDNLQGNDITIEFPNDNV